MMLVTIRVWCPSIEGPSVPGPPVTTFELGEHEPLPRRGGLVFVGDQALEVAHVAHVVSGGGVAGVDLLVRRSPWVAAPPAPEPEPDPEPPPSSP